MNNEDALYETEAEETIPLSFFVRYMDAVRRNWDEITGFKQAYQDNHRELATAHLNDMEGDDARLLWRAPTKGSVFSTREREFHQKKIHTARSLDE